MSILLVGVDEVGRGPIAGPVTVGVFMCDKKILKQIVKNGPSVLKDSKKLTKEKRELWFSYIQKCTTLGMCRFHVASVSALQIDRSGIQKAIRTAIKKSFDTLTPITTTRVLLDAGLRPPEQYKNYVSIIKGDEKEPIIAIASIMAKVMRDKYMARMVKKYPNYAFEKHVGYGTKEHYRLINKGGITPIHRKTYLKNILA